MMNRDTTERLSAAAIEDIVRNPQSIGAPTFEDFKRNYHSYMGREDDLFMKVDKGSELLKSRIKKYKFEVFNYKCKTLTEAEKVIKDYGFKISDMDMVPELIPQNSFDCDMLVKFVPRNHKG